MSDHFFHLVEIHITEIARICEGLFAAEEVGYTYWFMKAKETN